MFRRGGARGGAGGPLRQVGIAKPAAPGKARSVIAPWPTLATETLADYRVFRVRRVLRRSPRTGHTHDFYVLDTPGWVNIVALTPDDRMVLVEQFRHGTEAVELEVPGGVMDAEDASPEATAVRELREETGYAGEHARVIGTVRPNPAIMSNTCHVVLIERCVPRHEREFDHSEDLATHLVPVAEVPGLVARGRIRHSLVVAALYHFELWRRGLTGA